MNCRLVGHTGLRGTLAELLAGAVDCGFWVLCNWVYALALRVTVSGRVC